MSSFQFPDKQRVEAKYKQLLVWQKALQLAKSTYELTSAFPDDERFGLVSQMRRAAISVPSNIAEGQGRLTRGEFRQFVGHARGSVFELETQLRLSIELGFVSAEQAANLFEATAEVSRMLNGLLSSLNRGGINEDTALYEPIERDHA